MSADANTTTALHPIFQECCGETRYDTKQPFAVQVGDRWWVLATDRHIIARQICESAPPGAVTSGKLPGCLSLPWEAERQHVMPCPSPPPEPTPRKCGRCKGNGRLVCKTCGHERACPDCDGEGKIVFDKFAEQPISLEPLKTRVRPCFLRILHRHGAELHLGDDPTGCVGFTIPGTGIDGLLMPMVPWVPDGD